MPLAEKFFRTFTRNEPSHTATHTAALFAIYDPDGHHWQVMCHQ